ncbi:MAG: tetratricopeptide repeat protein [bacterium]
MIRTVRGADAFAHGRLSLLLAAALVAVATAACLSGTLENQFVEWDDHVAIVANPHIREFNGDNVRWMFSTFHLGPYQPLAWISLTADFTLWGLDPRGFHLTSLVIHVANTLLLFFLAHGWIREVTAGAGARGGTSASLIGAMAAALIFGIHPQRVESVAWATERRDVLCGFFTLLVALCWRARYDVPGDDEDGSTIARARRRHRRLYWAALFFFLLALLSKASVIGLPLVLAALDLEHSFRDSSRSRSSRRVRYRDLLLAQIPFLLAAGLIAALAVYGQNQANAIRSTDEVTYAWRIGTAAYATLFYVAKFLVPIGLSPLYETPAELSALFGRALGASVACVAVTVGCLALRRRRPALLVAWGAYLCLLSPTSGLVPIGAHLAADRYTYIAFLPWALLIAFAVNATIQRLGAQDRILAKLVHSMPLVLIVAALTWYSWLTPQQVRIWRGTLSLWEHAIRVDRNSSIARYGRAVALARAGREQEAIEDYSEAVRLRPNYADAHNNLGTILAGRGEFDDAEQHFLAAERAVPRDAHTQFNLGVLASKRGDVDTAVRRYREALAIRPNLEGARLNLAEILFAEGDTSAARQLLDEGQPEARRNSPAVAESDSLR